MVTVGGFVSAAGGEVTWKLTVPCPRLPAKSWACATTECAPTGSVTANVHELPEKVPSAVRSVRSTRIFLELATRCASEKLAVIVLAPWRGSEGETAARMI